MFDDIRAYPGNVHLIVSGTAASAATVVAMAADRVEMTPGSLFMCHDPLMGIYGNEAELLAGIDLHEYNWQTGYPRNNRRDRHDQTADRLADLIAPYTKRLLCILLLSYHILRQNGRSGFRSLT